MIGGIMSTKRPGAALTAPAMVNTWIGGADVAKSTCAAPGCESPVYARGWCRKHYERQRRTGSVGAGVQPHGSPPRPSPPLRLPRLRHLQSLRTARPA